MLCVDSLLDAWPRARVLLDAHRRLALPDDPRVVGARGRPAHLRAARSAWRHLHVVQGVTGERASWQVGADRLAGPDGVERVDVVAGTDHEVVVRWTTTRAERRAAHRPDRPPAEAASRTAATGDLSLVATDVTVQARWGGWA